MARVTVEDCKEQIPNRFELVVVASQRAREIGHGSPLTIARDNDKNPVVGLREIAAKSLNIDSLKENHIISLQKNHVVDEVIEENVFAEPSNELVEPTVDYSDTGEIVDFDD